jgi:hypothetical protein
MRKERKEKIAARTGRKIGVRKMKKDRGIGFDTCKRREQRAQRKDWQKDGGKKMKKEGNTEKWSAER